MSLEPLKDGIRSHVRIDFYGNVHKRLRGTAAADRYATEVAVLKVLEQRGCPYVPRLLEEHPDECYFVSTNCGQPASQISRDKADRIFAKLERDYGVRHLDAEPRNITYSDKLGCFCVIDFELAEILPLETPPGPSPESESPTLPPSTPPPSTPPPSTPPPSTLPPSTPPPSTPPPTVEPAPAPERR